MGSGIGTSSVADLYIDLGLPGVIVGHFLLGLLAGKLTQHCSVNGNWKSCFLFAISLGVFAIIARYALIPMLIKYMAFPFIVVFIAYRILIFLRSKLVFA